MKKDLYEQLSRLGKAVASPARLQLLDLLCQGPRTVESLAREAGLTLANTSQHLRLLHSARLVETEKAGLFVTYRLADESVCAFFQDMRSLGEKRLAEVDSILRQFREAPDSLEAVEKKTLVNRIRKGEVILLDVRPEEEYRAAHISGAVSVPLKELKCAPLEAASWKRNRGLLPRSLLRTRWRGRAAAEDERLSRDAAGRRRSRMARTGFSGCRSARNRDELRAFYANAASSQMEKDLWLQKQW